VRRVRMGAGVVALAVVAAACGGGGGGGGGSSPTTAGTPQRGGSMTYALEAETTDGFCLPEAQLAIAGIQVARTVYDTLTVPDASGRYVPWLARSLRHNRAYTKWTIDLRDGVKFHDGTDLTAQVVKNNLDAYRGAYEKTGPDGKKLRNPLLFFFVFQNVKSVDVTGPLQVTVATVKPWVGFDSYLWSSGRLGIMAQSQLDDPDTCDRKLVGTGPFEQKEWRVNDHFTVVRNPSWWYAKVSGKPYPYLDRIVYRPITKGDDRLRAFKAGAVDAAHFDNENQLRDLRAMAGGGQITLADSTRSTELNYTMLNASVAPFDDRRVRLAAAKAVDRNQMNELLWAGIGEVASGPFSPGNVGYLKDTGYPSYDPEGAKRLVREYERDTGQPVRVTLKCTDDPNTLELAQTYKNAWDQAGMNVTISPQSDQSQYISVAIGGDFQAITWRNHPGGDPDTQYVWWYDYHSNPVNFGRIDDPALNRLLDRGRSEPDPTARRAIYEDVNREFAKQVWNLWENWSHWAVPLGAGVHGDGGVFGPPLPGGQKPFDGLATGHPVYQLWRDRSG
jgi:peptide/nickel transport system substrate-binding protein